MEVMIEKRFISADPNEPNSWDLVSTYNDLAEAETVFGVMERSLLDNQEVRLHIHDHDGNAPDDWDGNCLIRIATKEGGKTRTNDKIDKYLESKIPPGTRKDSPEADTIKNNERAKIDTHVIRKDTPSPIR